MRKTLIAMTCLGLLAATNTAMARDPLISFDLALPLQPQKAKITTAIQGNDYNEISREDRLAVNEAFDRLTTRLAGHDSVQHLDPSARAAARDDQTAINEALARAYEESREVCEREKAIGSNRPTRVCKTVAERRRDREAAAQDRNRFQEMQRRNVPGASSF